MSNEEQLKKLTDGGLELHESLCSLVSSALDNGITIEEVQSTLGEEGGPQKLEDKLKALKEDISSK